MTDVNLPRFPERALTSRGVLYRPLQDVEVYVEDEHSEVFYTELLSRLIDTEVRIKRVFALRGKDRVLEECKRFRGTHSAVFIVDGDLDWVAGKPSPLMDRLFVHRCYCIENYLFCETAMVELIVENDGRLTREEARRKLGWSKIREAYQGPLTELFIEFATAHLKRPACQRYPQESGYSALSEERETTPDLDGLKVSSLCAQVRDGRYSSGGSQ